MMGNSIIACLATFPPRERVLEKTVASIIDQVDELRIWANGYTPGEIPDFLYQDKIIVDFGDDIGDNGKVANLPKRGYVFLVDDDILYPSNYVETLKNVIDLYNRQAVVGCHAAIMQPPIRNYFKDRQVFHFKAMVPRHTPVNVLGTGCLAYHTEYINFHISDAPCPNMLDVHFAVWCQKNRKRMLTVSRPAMWLRPQPVPESLWDSRGRGEEQTRYINKVKRWSTY